MDIVNLIFGIIGIIMAAVSLLYAVWVKRQTDNKIELREKTIRDIYYMATRALRGEITSEAKGCLADIKIAASEYKPKFVNMDDPELWTLDALWPIDEIRKLEGHKDVAEVWIVTRDLKPDAVDEELGRLVNKNIKAGKKYFYFVPQELLTSEIDKLKRNIRGARTGSKKLKSEAISIIRLDRNVHKEIFEEGNIALYFFRNQPNQPRCFAEVVFARRTHRGLYWEVLNEQDATNYFEFLRSKLSSSNDPPPAENIVPAPPTR